MRGSLRLPAVCLLIAATSMLVLRLGGPSLKPEKVPDTPGYLEVAAAGSLSEVFSGYRTVGYPLFLRLMGAADGDFQHLPLAHLLAFLAGTFAVFWTLAGYTGRPWLALAGALPLLASRSLTLLHRIQSDMLAVGLGLATVALLLAFATSPRSRPLAVALGVVLFTTYQVRPAYLFLIVLVPLAAPVLRLAKEGKANLAALRSLGRWSLGVAGLAVVPFLLFCTLRLAVVGEFGLVSFGGFNLAGLASNFLDGALVEDLPAEQQPLAREILARRKAAGLKPLKPGGLTRKWYPQFNDNVWQRAVPILEARLGRRSVSAQAINDELSALSGEILRRRPRLYAKWIVDSFVYGVAGAVDDGATVCLGLTLALALPLLLLSPACRERPPPWAELAAYAFLAALYLAGSLGLIVLVEVPFRRYVSTVGLLIPCALAMALFEVLRIGAGRITTQWSARKTIGGEELAG